MNKNFSYFESIIQEQFIGSFASSIDKIKEWISVQTPTDILAIANHHSVLVSRDELKNGASLEVFGIYESKQFFTREKRTSR